MNWKVLGAILLIVGTSIGGGMLALPAVTAQAGVGSSSVFLLVTWIMMACGAWLLLEVNLKLPAGSNLISMVRRTLGRKAEWLAWGVYLSLLYCLLCAYVAGGEDLIKGLLALEGIHLPGWIGLILFVAIFGGVVCVGVRSVDLINRCIMAAKMGAFLFIVWVTVVLIRPANLTFGTYRPLVATVTTMITSFGFAIIIPSLRAYLGDNPRQLRIALFVGCLVPLICYVLWESIIFGVLPKTGPGSLQELARSAHPISELMRSLAQITQSDMVVLAAKIFTSVCVITAFLGVSLCLNDFLADGLGMVKKGLTGWVVHGLTFVPPIVLVLFWPRLFLWGISWAGIFCIILLMLLPACMALKGLAPLPRRWIYPFLLRAYVAISVVVLVWGVLVNLGVRV